jgi:hypothetical protein
MKKQIALTALVALMSLSNVIAKSPDSLNMVAGEYNLEYGSEKCAISINMGFHSNEGNSLEDHLTISNDSIFERRLILGKSVQGKRVIKTEIRGTSIISVVKQKRLAFFRKHISTLEINKAENGLRYKLIANDETLNCKYLKIGASNTADPVIINPNEPVTGRPIILGETFSDEPREKFKSIKKVMRSLKDILNPATRVDVMKDVNKIKSATSKYYNEVLVLVAKESVLSVEEVSLIMDVLYYEAKDFKKLNNLMNEARAQNNSEVIKLLTKHEVKSASLSILHNQIIDAAFSKVITSNFNEKIELINLVYPSIISSNHVVASISNITNITNEYNSEELSILAQVGLSKNAYTVVAKTELIKIVLDQGEVNYKNVKEVFQKYLNIEGAELAAQKVIYLGANELTAVNFEQMIDLVQLLDSDFEKYNTSVTLLKINPLLNIDELVILVASNANGTFSSEQYRDNLALSNLKSFDFLDSQDISLLTQLMDSELNKKTLLVQNLTKNPDLDTTELKLQALLTKNGSFSSEQYRDDIVRGFRKVIKSASANEVIDLITVVKSNNSKKDIAFDLTKILIEKTNTNISKISKAITNGSFSSEQYRDVYLISACTLIQTLTDARDIKIIVESHGKSKNKLNEMVIALKKIESISTDEFLAILSTIKNGSFSSEQYRDEAIIKGILKVSDINPANLAKIGKELKSDAKKLSLYRVQKNKLGAISAEGIKALAITIKNGSLSSEQYKDGFIKAFALSLDTITAQNIYSVITLAESQDVRKTAALQLFTKLETKTEEAIQLIAAGIHNGSFSSEQYKTSFINASRRLL